jgi:hypothetical protein
MATDCFTLSFPSDLSPVHFIKLILTDSAGKVASENPYWHSAAKAQAEATMGGAKKKDAFENYRALNEMKPVSLKGSFSKNELGGTSTLTITIENPTSQIALMAAVKVVKVNAPADRILPIYYDDNYVTLLPHEKKVLHAEFDSALLKGSAPSVELTGWNITPLSLSPSLVSSCR